MLFPIVHGTFGEDGVLQGLLESLGIPYVGFGVAASAVGMDKIFMKAAFGAAGLPQVEYVAFSGAEWKSREIRASIVERASRLGFPLFVKPACAGSSVGVSKVKSEAGLAPAVEEALLVDGRVLAEKGVDGREIECSVLEGEMGRPTEASLPGEIVPAVSSTTTRTSTSARSRVRSSRQTCLNPSAARCGASRSVRSTSSAAPASRAWTSSSSAAPTGCS